jgi:hypothetical protein
MLTYAISEAATKHEGRMRLVYSYRLRHMGMARDICRKDF